MRGDVTEAAALVRHGLPVLIPFCADEPYDLVVDVRDGSFIRVQCKTARQPGDGTLVFNSVSTDHGSGVRDYQGRADVFGVHCPGIDRVFIVPVAAATRSKTSLRLTPARNNQERRVRFADDFDVAAWASRVRRQEAGGPAALAA
jgi:hypothetical protein